MSVVSTSVPSVFASQDALSLVEKFYSCPAALKQISSKDTLKPLYVISTTEPTASTISRKIQIPKQWLQTNKGLTSLAFEIFNAQVDLGLDLAKLKNMGIDNYAIEIEKKEHSRTQGHYQLIKQCAEIWGLSSSEIRNEHDLIVSLFIQEVSCHTDYYRKYWIDYLQVGYCAKHPEDRRSCEVKKEDLCDPMKLLKLTKEEALELRKKRFCKMFPHAHEKVKDLYGERFLKDCNSEILTDDCMYCARSSLVNFGKSQNDLNSQNLTSRNIILIAVSVVTAIIMLTLRRF